MAYSRPNPMLLTSLILLVIFTVIFTILIFHRSTLVRKLREGDAEDPQRKESITKIEGDVREARGKVQLISGQIALRDRELYRLDLELAKFRTYYAGDQLISGTTGEEVTYEGRTYKLKESNWKQSRELVSQSGARLAALQAEHESAERQSFPRLEEAIVKRQNEQQAVLTRSSEMDAAFRTDEERLTKQKEDLEAEKLKTEKQRREDFGRRQTKIGQKKDEIRTLLELELRWMKELESDGEVLAQGSEHGFVVVNKGSADGFFPGMILEDFQYDKGRYIEKGLLEVIDARSQISTCRVISEIDAKRYPIAQGDQIGNPVFDARQPKVFVLAGEFKRYNKEDIESFIRATGGIVRQQLSPGVDFLVAGERSDRQQDNAREYQVQAMTEAQLLKYVQPAFAAGEAAAAAAAPAAPADAAPAEPAAQ